jgi:alpha-maltose-1-phosphate synthase
VILVAHPLGNACVRALLAGLRDRALLGGYVTTLGFHRDDRWIDLLPAATRDQLHRRRYDLPTSCVERHPVRETTRLVCRALGLTRLTIHEKGWASVDAVFHDLDRQAARSLAARPDVRGVYGYEDGALALFRAAQRRNLARCYELPMGYWRGAQHLFAEEAELQPDWAATLDGLQDSRAKLERKDAELALATHVIVASDFSRRSLDDFRAGLTADVTVIPHAAPPAIDERALLDRLAARPAGPLRVLYVGGLSQRKGISYLFKAMRQLHTVAELTVVGRPAGAECAALTRALSEHRHLASLPPPALFALMQQHDVLVLPSLWEGFGLVLVEAMAQGLPVIATPHTAAPDLLVGTDAGMIVPIRSEDALVSALHVLALDPARREAMACAARTVAARLNRSVWQTRLAEFCQIALSA